MYLTYFGLQQLPFKNTPNTRLFFSGGERGAILEALIYTANSGEGIVKVVGEVGSGKTMLCRMLATRLPEHIDVVYLANPRLAPDRVLHAIAMELKLEVPTDSDQFYVLHLLQADLLKKHSNGRRVVVFVEEAQCMPLQTLEEIRLLSNLETSQNKLLQMILFGQPELDENLARQEIRQVKDRISYNFTLKPFTQNEVKEYIHFRLRAAGYSGDNLFQPRAIKRIFRMSKGLTRRINLLADKSLLAAYSNKSEQVLDRYVKSAAIDSGYPSPMMLLPKILMGSFATFACVLIVGWMLSQQNDITPITAQLPVNTAVMASLPTNDTEKPALDTVNMALFDSEPNAHDSNAPANEIILTPTPIAKADTKIGNQSLPEKLPSNPVVAMQATAKPQIQQQPTRIQPLSIVTSTQPTRASTNSTPSSLSIAALETNSNIAREPAVTVLQDRLAATESWLSQVDTHHYTIQVMWMVVAKRKWLGYYLMNKGDDVDRFFVQLINGKDKSFYKLYYGDYTSSQEALNDLDNLPRDLARNRPFIVSLRRLK